MGKLNILSKYNNKNNNRYKIHTKFILKLLMYLIKQLILTLVYYYLIIIYIYKVPTFDYIINIIIKIKYYNYEILFIRLNSLANMFGDLV